MITLGDLNSVSTLSQGAWANKNGFEQGVNTVGAALVDVGVTLWNSVANVATLGNYDDVSTRTVLQSMGADGAVSAYDNNRDTIDLISFVGGVFIPGGAAVKLSKAVRAGMKGTSFLSPVRHKDDLLKFEGLIKDAKTGTAEYRKIKRDMFLRGQAENAMDVVAAEVAIMGTFNAHPFMEDYLEDPISNFGLSLAIGGVAGGAITGLLSRSEILNTVGKVQSKEAGVVFEAARQYSTPFSDTASSLTQLELAAKNLDNIAAKETLTPLAKEMAVSMAGTMRATMGRIREGTVSEDILKGITNADQKSQILSLFNDVRFLGAEKMSFYTPTTNAATKANLQAPKLNPLQRMSNAIFRKEEIDLGTGNSEQVFIKDNFFSQELGAFLDRKSADLVATAADITTPQGIAQRAKKYSLKQVQSDFKERVQFASGGEVEADYLARLKFFSDKDTKSLLKAELMSDDLPAINGWLGSVESRIKQLTTEANELEGQAAIDAIDEMASLQAASIKIVTKKAEVPNSFTTQRVASDFPIDPTDAVRPLVAPAERLMNRTEGLNTMGLEDIRGLVKEEKLLGIAKQLEAGQPKELIALRYNTDIETVELLGSGRTDLIFDKAEMLERQFGKDFSTKFNRWNSPEQLEDAFAPTRRTLKVSADSSKIMGYTGELLDKQRDAILGATNLNSLEKQLLNNGSGEGAQKIAAKVAMIDSQFNDINRLWVENAVLTSKSRMARELNNRILARDEVNVLREGMKEFVNGKGGNPLYSSADFVTSRMGQVGRLVTTLGDERVHTVNKLFEEMMTPVSTHLRQIQASDVMRTEFAIFDNLRQSTKGLLRFDPEQSTWVTAGPETVWDRKLGSFVKMETREDGSIVKVAVPGVPAFEGKVVQNEAVRMAFTELQAAGDEVWEMQSTLNKVKGVQEPADIGFWIPSTNLVNTNRAFILNRDNSSIKLIVGKDKDDLESLMANYKLEPNESLLTPAQVEQMKLSVHGDLLDDVGRADVQQLKQGIGLAAPDISSDRLADIINGFKDRLNYQATNFMENSLFDVTSKLDQLSAYNTRLTAKQSKQGFMSAVKQLQTKDTAKDIKAILTGNSQAGSQELMGYINKFASGTLHYAIGGFQKAFEAVRPTYKNQDVDYKKFSDALAAQGIDDPFKVFNDAARPLLYQRAKDSGYSVTPDRLVNESNALAATMALKFMELAQPLVNMMSLPILQISTINRAFKASQIEGADQLLANGPLSIMMNGVRRVNSQLPENTKFMKYFEEEGLLESTISEVDTVIKQARFGTGGIVGGLEKALDSKFVEVMSKPSEMAEQLVRKTTLMTGVELAKRIYGNAASDRQVTIFARDFLKQTIGNYSTSQRPMMFQGTFGAAMGLFQTYMLTYAQNMYRHLDLKDYKGLGQTMLAQAGIFGAGSLPGFQQTSLAIGENFSDENMDLVRGVYRGLPDPLANLLIYGMPSNLAPAVHTRGDVTPRIPTGFETMVAPSMIGQALQSLVDVGKSILQADVNTGQAFMEALSMQSVSRPIARLSELASGYSVTRAGNQIAGNEEVWSWQGIVARILSTRTLAEAKVREAIHLNSVYGAANSENRNAVLSTLRTAIRNDSVDDELLDNLANEYLRTGSPQGFRQAVNQAFMENSNEKLVDLHGRLGNSPLMLMIDDLD